MTHLLSAPESLAPLSKLHTCAASDSESHSISASLGSISASRALDGASLRYQALLGTPEPSTKIDTGLSLYPERASPIERLVTGPETFAARIGSKNRLCQSCNDYKQ